VIAGQTLTSGGVVVVSGVSISLAPGGSQIVVGGSTGAIPTQASGATLTTAADGTGGTSAGSSPAMFTGSASRAAGGYLHCLETWSLGE